MLGLNARSRDLCRARCIGAASLESGRAIACQDHEAGDRYRHPGTTATQTCHRATVLKATPFRHGWRETTSGGPDSSDRISPEGATR